jgi:uncharacterized RDD family membrane protein YckC
MAVVPETEEAPAATPPALLDRVPIVALRVVQFALDLAIVALITMIPMALALLLLPRNPDDSLGALLITIPVILALLVLAVVISWWYWARLPRRRGGRTLVMGWFGLRVMNLDGGEPTGSQLTLRWLLLVVDAMFFGAVGLIAMLSTATHQRIGDSLADTLVVRSPGPRSRAT